VQENDQKHINSSIKKYNLIDTPTETAEARFFRLDQDARTVLLPDIINFHDSYHVNPYAIRTWAYVFETLYGFPNASLDKAADIQAKIESVIGENKLKEAEKIEAEARSYISEYGEEAYEDYAHDSYTYRDQYQAFVNAIELAFWGRYPRGGSAASPRTLRIPGINSKNTVFCVREANLTRYTRFSIDLSTTKICPYSSSPYPKISSSLDSIM